MYSSNPDLNAGGGLFGKYKMTTKNKEIAEILANGYSSESTQRELSHEYHYVSV